MMLVFVRAVLRQAVRETNEPGAIVSRVARAVYFETRGESYLTCVVVRVDEESRRLTSTNAGHPPALISGSAISRLTRGGPPAGLLPDARSEEDTVDLVAGNRLIIVTTGSQKPWQSGSTLQWPVSTVTCPHSSSAKSILDLTDSRKAVSPVAGWTDDRTVLVMAVD